MEKEYFIHSKCCVAHWELVFIPGENRMELRCEKCGKPAGVKVEKPEHMKCECGICKEKGNEV